MTALKKDCVSLHASAFVYRDVGVLVTGWSKGGKTEALLAFAEQGARYIGDEWVLLSGDGQKMYGVPENIRLWDWHLKNLPHVWSKVQRRERLFFNGIHGLDSLQHAIPFGKLSPNFPLLGVMPALRRKLNVRLTPQTIFGDPLGPFVAKPEKLFLMINHQASSIEIEPSDPLSIAKRMISSIQHEQLPLMASYLSFKFAFPGMRNDFIERAHELQSDILCRALADKDAYTVRHPYPVSFRDLHTAMRPFVEHRGNNPASLAENLCLGNPA